ncbi:MAG: hypothetical protein AAF493_18200 [Pseudomonadota bacterium]
MANSVAKLLAWTVANSTYGPPSVPPDIEYQSAEHFRETVCGSVEPCRARGYYKDGSHKVVLHDSYKRIDTIEKQALVVHELLHYLQDTSGRWLEGDPCEIWIARETESFRLQLKFIARRTGGISLYQRMPKFDRAHCERAVEKTTWAGEQAPT